MTTTNFRRRVAAVLAAGLALAGVAASATPAAAWEAAPTEPYGSLTVHKYLAPDAPTGLPNDGAEVDLDTHGLTPLPGIGFTVRQVTEVDLRTNYGWERAANLARELRDDPERDPLAPGFLGSLGDPVHGITDQDGTHAFRDLPIGLYLVTEDVYGPEVTPAVPFLVTIPMTDPRTGDGWLYDVHVYPKNSVDTIEKSVDDALVFQPERPFEWRITADIPNVEKLDAYKIVDNLDDRLHFDGVAVALTGAGAPVLVPGQHYVVTPAGPEGGGPVVTVEFTSEGRAVLAEHTAGQVEVVITTSVTDIGDGKILNSAVLYANDEHWDYVPGEPGDTPPGDIPPTTPPVESRWGRIELVKHDLDDGTPLAGAEFRLWAEFMDDDGNRYREPVNVRGAEVWATGPDGRLLIDGVRLSHWARGGEVMPGQPGYVEYWLEEVRAPAGYERLPELIPVEVRDEVNTVDVANVKSNAGFMLPMTGGAGLHLLYVAGGLLVGGAVLLTVRNRRLAAR